MWKWLFQITYGFYVWIHGGFGTDRRDSERETFRSAGRGSLSCLIGYLALSWCCNIRHHGLFEGGSGFVALLRGGTAFQLF